MKPIFKRTDTGFTPDSHEAQELWGKTKPGQLVTMEVKRERNLQWHKKFFALLHIGHDNQERYTDFEDYKFAMKVATGWCTELIRSNGELMYRPKSYAFNSMSQQDFEAVYNKTIDVTLKIIPMEKADLEREIIAFG